MTRDPSGSMPSPSGKTVVALRHQRGSSATKLDANSASSPKLLLPQIGKKYDVNSVGNNTTETTRERNICVASGLTLSKGGRHSRDADSLITVRRRCCLSLTDCSEYVLFSGFPRVPAAEGNFSNPCHQARRLVNRGRTDLHARPEEQLPPMEK